MGKKLQMIEQNQMIDGYGHMGYDRSRKTVEKRVSAMDSRTSKQNYYLDIADSVLKRSTCLRRKYGAIIVRNDTARSQTPIPHPR